MVVTVPDVPSRWKFGQSRQVGDLGDEGRELPLDIGDHGFEDVRRYDPAAVALGERDDADLHRVPGAHPVTQRAVLTPVATPSGLALTGQPDDLGGSAADVEENDAFRIRVGETGAAGRREKRLRLPIDDLQRQTGRIPHLRQEGQAVGSRAAGFRGDQTRPCDVTALNLVAADPQRGKGAIHRRLR